MSVRERMVSSAVILLAERGFHGASLAKVLAGSGAPRGSIYHHFPDGKDQLVAAAVEAAQLRRDRRPDHRARPGHRPR
jgi:TetR/AcrR family transcriptional regulator, lmrAB and yxaGH operons repressor